jgi:S-formylglutathione hydrolase FrmB
MSKFGSILCSAVIGLSTSDSFAQTPYPVANSVPVSQIDRTQMETELVNLKKHVADLKATDGDLRLVADVEVFAKAAEWILRHGEFYKANYVAQTQAALKTGLARAKELAAGKPSWLRQTGTTVRGYYSRVDGSVQPYALTLPKGINPRSGQRWPLHVKLHGRAGTMNEVNFISRHERKSLPKEQTWVQLDVFGRTNNAYRWAGETDVFEAMADLNRTVRIDSRRITLWGFSMGGAGAWHLGLHHPSKWSSVGPGAGFVDFYRYQKQTERRPVHQHLALRIYDAVDYTQNAFNVPICTYGSENDAQLVASTEIVDAAKKLGIDIKLVIGKGVGHKFTPEGFREFMDFHLAHSKTGRPRFPGRRNIDFFTQTLKYNRCEWLAIEEMEHMYEPARVQGRVDEQGVLHLKTQNVAALQLARDVSDDVVIDGAKLKLNSAAEGLLPGVYYVKGSKEWYGLTYNESREFPNNRDFRKRHNLQGPIDDAFMEPFVCVRGTGKPWSQNQQAWANWTLERFGREYDKWLRGRVPVADDVDVDPLTLNKNLILFGDPGSNRVLAKIIDKLPIKWTKDGIEVDGKTYDPETHGLSMIYPNPLNPTRYVVINSGHTFHAEDFIASNSWLFPRLGDIAVQKFERSETGDYKETVAWATLFDMNWQLPRADKSK